jgi:hypothetical protein
MATSYKEIRNERQWKAMTGLSEQEFISLSTAFGIAYEKINDVTLQQGIINLSKEVVLSSYEDCLYFTLFELKTAQSFDCLGVLFNMDGATANRNFIKYVQVVGLALQQQGALPRRSFASLNDFKKYLQAEEELIVDARVPWAGPKPFKMNREQVRVQNSSLNIFKQRCHWAL